MRIVPIFLLVISLNSCVLLPRSEWNAHKGHPFSTRFVSNRPDWIGVAESKRLDKQYAIRKNMYAKIDSIYIVKYNKKMLWSYCDIMDSGWLAGDDTIGSMKVRTHLNSNRTEVADILIDSNLNVLKVEHYKEPRRF